MSDIQTRYYVEFMHPGLFMSESSGKQIDDPNHVEWPASAYGMRTYARTVSIQNGEELLGAPRDHSVWTYRGEVYDLARVKRELPGERILIQNMSGNGYERVVKAFGRFYPVEKNDRVEEPSHV